MSQDSRLEVINNQGWRKEYPLQKSIIYIGSAPTNDITLQNGVGVDAMHAQLIASAADNSSYKLVNLSNTAMPLGSSGGDSVLPPRAVLEMTDGQTFSVGQFTLIFYSNNGGGGSGHSVAASAARGTGSKRIGLSLLIPVTQLAPNQSLEGVITVTNLGEQTGVRFDLTLEGMDADCYDIAPGPLLSSGAQKDVHFRIHHRGIKPLAGDWLITVRASASRSYPGEQAVTSQVIHVLPFYRHQMSIFPTKGVTPEKTQEPLAEEETLLTPKAQDAPLPQTAVVAASQARTSQTASAAEVWAMPADTEQARPDQEPALQLKARPAKIEPLPQAGPVPASDSEDWWEEPEQTGTQKQETPPSDVENLWAAPADTGPAPLVQPSVSPQAEDLWGTPDEETLQAEELWSADSEIQTEPVAPPAEAAQPEDLWGAAPEPQSEAALPPVEPLQPEDLWSATTEEPEPDTAAPQPLAESAQAEQALPTAPPAIEPPEQPVPAQTPEAYTPSETAAPSATAETTAQEESSVLPAVAAGVATGVLAAKLATSDTEQQPSQTDEKTQPKAEDEKAEKDELVRGETPAPPAASIVAPDMQEKQAEPPQPPTPPVQTTAAKVTQPEEEHLPEQPQPENDTSPPEQIKETLSASRSKESWWTRFVQILPFGRDKTPTPPSDEIRHDESEPVKEEVMTKAEPPLSVEETPEPETKPRPYDEMPTSLSEIASSPTPPPAPEILAEEPILLQTEDTQHLPLEAETEQTAQPDALEETPPQADIEPEPEMKQAETEQAETEQAQEFHQVEVSVPTEAEISPQPDEEHRQGVKAEDKKEDEHIAPTPESEIAEKTSVPGAKTKDTSIPADINIPLPGFVEKQRLQESVPVAEDLPVDEPQADAAPVAQEEPQYPINLETYTLPQVKDTDNLWSDRGQTEKQQEAINLEAYTAPQSEDLPISDPDAADWWGDEAQTDQPAKKQQKDIDIEAYTAPQVEEPPTAEIDESQAQTAAQAQQEPETEEKDDKKHVSEVETSGLDEDTDDWWGDESSEPVSIQTQALKLKASPPPRARKTQRSETEDWWVAEGE